MPQKMPTQNFKNGMAFHLAYLMFRMANISAATLLARMNLMTAMLGAVNSLLHGTPDEPAADVKELLEDMRALYEGYNPSMDNEGDYYDYEIYQDFNELQWQLYSVIGDNELVSQNMISEIIARSYESPEK